MTFTIHHSLFTGRIEGHLRDASHWGRDATSIIKMIVIWTDAEGVQALDGATPYEQRSPMSSSPVRAQEEIKPPFGGTFRKI